MADNKLLQQMLEHLVNDEQAKAEELFHEYVVQQSREIYESMIDSEIAEEKDEDEDEEDMEEAASDEDAEEDKVDEEFEDLAIEADDEMGLDSDDPTDDLAAEIGDEEGEEGEKSEEELFQDLDAIVDELQAKFDELKGGDEGEMDMGDEEAMKDDFELETVREYVEKVPAGHGAEKKGSGEAAGANTKSTIDNMKNDMGGTTANIVKGGVESESASTKGGLLNPSTKDINSGNINVPGGKAGGAFSKKEPGHGAEKKGSAESADNKQSLFRGRR
jgi:hypothetical protein